MNQPTGTGRKRPPKQTAAEQAAARERMAVVFEKVGVMQGRVTKADADAFVAWARALKRERERGGA